MFRRPPDDERGDAGGFGGELQPPRRSQRDAVEFTDDAGKAAHSQPLFHDGQDLRVLPCFAEDDPVWMKPNASERGREKVAAVQAPKHGALQARENAGSEKESAGGIASARAVFAELMHGAEGKATSGKGLVHPGNPKG